MMSCDIIDWKDPSDSSRYLVFTEAQAPLLARKAHIIQGEHYLRHGIVKPDALLADGSLLPEIDKMRGPDVLYIMRIDKNPAICTTMRVLDLHGSYENAPSFQRCQAQLYPKSISHLKKDQRVLKEAGAFAGTPAATVESSVAMYKVLRYALHLGVQTSEVWLIGMVTSTYEALIRTLGPTNLRILGTDTFFDPRVNAALKIGLMYPVDFRQNLAADIRRLLEMLEFFDQAPIPYLNQTSKTA